MALFDSAIFDAAIFDTGPSGPVGLFATHASTEGSDTIAVSATLGAAPTQGNSLNFGAGNTTRYHTFTGPALNNSGDWAIGLWIRPDTMNAGETGFQYILSNGALGGVDTVNIYLQENNSGASLAAFVANSTAATLVNTGVAGAWPKDGTNYFVVLQKRGTNFEIYRVVKGASTATPTTIATTETGTIPSKTFYVGSRADLNVDRFYENPLGEIFFLTGDSLTNAEVITLAAGAHITAVRTTRAVDLRFREDLASEPDLSGNGRNTTRFGTGYTLAPEFFPDGAPTDLIVTQAVTEGSDTHASDVDIRLSVSQASTEGSDTHSSDVDIRLSVSQSSTEGSDTHASDVDVRLTVSQSSSEGSDTISSDVDVLLSASQASTEGSDTFAGSVTVELVGATATQAVTEGSDTHSSDVDVVLVSSQSVAEGADTISSDVDAIIQAFHQKNFVVNSEYTGASVGGNTMGTGFYGLGTLSGITRSVVGTGVENGRNYVDVRFFGTCTGQHADVIGPTPLAVLPGQSYNYSAYIGLVGGSWPAISVNLHLVQRNSGGTGLAFDGVDIRSLVTGPTQVRVSRPYTITDPSAVNFDTTIRIDPGAGVTVDFTVRVSGIQITRGLDLIDYNPTYAGVQSGIRETTSDTISSPTSVAITGGLVYPTVRTNLIWDSGLFSLNNSNLTFVSGPGIEGQPSTVFTVTGGTAALHYARSNGIDASVIGTVYTFSIVVRASTGFIQLTPTSSIDTTPAWANFNLATGEITRISGDAPDIFDAYSEPFGVDSWRFGIKFRATVATTNFQPGVIVPVSTALSNRLDTNVPDGYTFEIAAAQFEVGGMTPFIPTTSRPVSVSNVEPTDSYSSSALVAIQIAQVSSEGADTISSTAQVLTQVSQSVAEGSDTITSSANVSVLASQASTEGADTHAASMTAEQISGTASMAATEGSDTHSSNSVVAIAASQASTEPTDTISSNVVTPIFAEPRKNIIRNSEMVNAPIGVLTSTGNNVGNPAIGYFGGTGSAGANIVKEIVATGTTPEGYKYFDYRISGTNTHTAVVRPDLYLSGLSNPPHYEAYPGQTWTAHLGTEVVAGSRTGFESPFNGPRIAEMDSTGNYLVESGSAGSNLPGIKTWTRTLTNPNTRRVALYISFGILVGATVDLTLRVYAPMLERGSVAGPYLPTTGSPIGTLPEIGSDVANLTANVEVQLSHSVEEASDAFSANIFANLFASQSADEIGDTSTGSVSVLAQASQASTEFADTISASVVAVVVASMAATDAADTQASNASVLVQASQASTDAGDTMAAQASVSASAAISATEVGDTTSAAFQALVAASMASTDGVDSTAVQANVVVQFSQASTEGADTHSAAATVSTTATLSASDSADSAQVVSTILVLGTQIAQESADTAAANVSVALNSSQASTEGSDFTSVDTDAIIAASTDATEGADTHSATATTGNGWNIALTEVGQDTAAVSANLRSISALTALEGADSATGSMNVLAQASQTAAEGSDTIASTASTVQPSLTQASTEGLDTIASSIGVRILAAQSVAEVGQDTFASQAFALIRATQASTDDADTISGSANVSTQAFVQAVEQGDSTTTLANVLVNLSINRTEGSDSASANVSVGLFATHSTEEFADTFFGQSVALIRGIKNATEDADTHAATGEVVDVPIYVTLNAQEASDAFYGEIETTNNVYISATEGFDTAAAIVALAKQERNLPPIIVNARKYGHYRESADVGTTVMPRKYSSNQNPKKDSARVTQRRYQAFVDK